FFGRHTRTPAAAVVLEDEGPGTVLRRIRRPPVIEITAGCHRSQRPHRAISPYGPQLRVHCGIGNAGRSKRKRDARSGKIPFLSSSGPFTLVLLQQDPVQPWAPRLFPFDSGGSQGAGTDRGDLLGT